MKRLRRFSENQHELLAVSYPQGGDHGAPAQLLILSSSPLSLIGDVIRPLALIPHDVRQAPRYLETPGVQVTSDAYTLPSQSPDFFLFFFKLQHVLNKINQNKSEGFHDSVSSITACQSGFPIPFFSVCRYTVLRICEDSVGMSGYPDQCFLDPCKDENYGGHSSNR